MDRIKLDRISELTAISKKRELTADEKEERQLLRAEYLAEIKSQVKEMLNDIEIVDEQ
ncbi:MAG: DUF896 domain-containing protein [Clostridia bacterium]|nr:DUF896 domain-containing protein [Clostridia bacterium]